MNEQSKITYISVDKLHPHPDNPRKEIGDVTELADSIRENGIYQNLTVIPATGYYYGDYTVIIGHRRLAAAKAAGLTEVPCIITEMSKKEQLATMLLENMQRSDLTILEQAQGMQMMLDMGESVEDISQKTGFSESTVRRRVRLCKLDKEKMQAAQARQISMADYDRLFEIEDSDRRNKLLDSIGTKNFNWDLKNALSAERMENTVKEVLNALKQYYPDAEEKDNIFDVKYVTDVCNANDVKSLELSGKIYYTKKSWSGSVSIYRAYTAEELAKKDKRREEYDRRENKLTAIKEQCESVYNGARELRKEFWRTFNQGDFRTAHSVISKMLVRAIFVMMDCYYGCIDHEIFEYVTDSEISSPLSMKDIKGTNGAAKLAYAVLEKTADNDKTYDYCCRYESNEILEFLYNSMAELGYEISDDEMAMLNGTHDMYLNEEDEDE